MFFRGRDIVTILVIANLMGGLFGLLIKLIMGTGVRGFIVVFGCIDPLLGLGILLRVFRRMRRVRSFISIFLLIGAIVSMHFLNFKMISSILTLYSECPPPTASLVSNYSPSISP